VTRPKLGRKERKDSYKERKDSYKERKDSYKDFIRILQFTFYCLTIVKNNTFFLNGSNMDGCIFKVTAILVYVIV